MKDKIKANFKHITNVIMALEELYMTLCLATVSAFGVYAHYKGFMTNQVLDKSVFVAGVSVGLLSVRVLYSQVIKKMIADSGKKK